MVDDTEDGAEHPDAPSPWAPLEPEPGTPPPPRPPAAPAPPQGWQPPPAAPPQPWPPQQGWQQPPPPWQQPYWQAPPPLPKAGDARTGPLPLHPMTMSDVLDGAFKLFKANARTVMLITAAFVVPLQLVGAFAQRNILGGRGFLDIVNHPATARASVDNRSTAQTVVALVTSAILLLVTPFVAGAISRVVAASYLGREETPGSALRATGRRWWALLGAWFLVHVLEAVGFVLCILPGLLAMALFVATAPAIVTEELGPVAGMRRSWRLVRRRLFPVLGIALVSGLLASVLGNVLGGVPTAIALAIGLKWAWPLLAVGSIISALVTTPFVAIVATLIYFDGRIRQEGFDLQVMAQGLATRAQTP
jgi:hypothetical protein